jgi:hypothetical protein
MEQSVCEGKPKKGRPLMGNFHPAWGTTVLIAVLLIVCGVDTYKYVIKRFSTGTVVIIKYIFFINPNAKIMTILHINYVYLRNFYESMHTAKKNCNTFILSLEKYGLLFRLETRILQMFNCP